MNTNVYQNDRINQAPFFQMDGYSPNSIEPLKDRERFVNEVLSLIYYTQVRCSKSRGHNPPTYTRLEFIERFKKDPKFVSIFDEWLQNGCQTYMKPSFDRIDNSKGYSFENINLTTWAQNAINGNISRRKSVSIYKNGQLVSASESQVAAAKLTGHCVDYIKKIQDTGKESPRGYSFYQAKSRRGF